MKREDLFAAIGQVEEERLARSEGNVVPSGHPFKEETQMKNHGSNASGKILRCLLIAAVVVTMLATTAFAYTGFVVYENPGAMLEAFFGEQPTVHGPDCGCEKCTAAQVTAEREKLDLETAMDAIAPYISQVGDSMVDECMGNRLTVDAYTYDPHTGCGLVYYTLENEKGRTISYNLQPDGEIYDISPSTNYPSKDYLIQGESTATRLKIACYFIKSFDNSECYFRIGFNGFIREDSEAETTDYLCLPLTDNNMSCLTLEGGELVLSSMGLKIGDLPCVREGNGHEPKVRSVTIRYQDGTDYVVTDETDGNAVRNFGYSLMEFEEDFYLIFALNRVVNLSKVSAIVINGTEFPVT